MAPPPSPVARPRPPRPQAPSAESRTQALLQAWADGKATLKDVRGYTDEELFAVANAAHTFFYQGRVQEARVLFQGLFAVDPTNAYYARGLGVVEMAAGNGQGALAAFDVAVKLSPQDASLYVGRAEVRLAAGQKAGAVEDLRRAASLVHPDDAVGRKATALLSLLSRR